MCVLWWLVILYSGMVEVVFLFLQIFDISELGVTITTACSGNIDSEIRCYFDCLMAHSAGNKSNYPPW